MAKGLLVSSPDGRTVSPKNDLQSMKCFGEESASRSNEAPVSPDRSGSKIIARQVSHDGFVPITEKSKALVGDSLRGSPVRCVSEFDRVTSQGAFAEKLHDICASSLASAPAPAMPNPLQNRRFLSHHVHSLRLEAELLPLRLILSRLMAHSTYNKRGLFNSPVDPVALKLPDYFSVIEIPMDLGTVKKRLHSFEYKSRNDAANDIRLCFSNAMTYNHPQNYVHLAAKELLMLFEDQLAQVCSEAVSSPPPTNDPTVAASASVPSDPKSPQPHLDHIAAKPPVYTDSLNETRPRAVFQHGCQWCMGNVCSICMQGCLHMEPSLLVCMGPNCANKRIRKHATYYISSDGSSQYCQRCHSGLPSVLPLLSPGDVSCRYKRDLLKRRNDEELVERWVSCTVCHSANHQVCAMFNPHVHDIDSYVCPSCLVADSHGSQVGVGPTAAYSFVAGETMPVPLTQLGLTTGTDGECVLGADALPTSSLASFIEEKVRAVLAESEIPSAASTITVRVVSDCHKIFNVPEVIRNHFELVRNGDGMAGASLPSAVPYRSKAIVLFQKIDGFDVCIFCMYVHEYDDISCYEEEQEKRVYIAYLDSVDYFRPRTCRTKVYHEIITAYLATARKRNFTSAHIWACPPSRGNSFVFWNHPSAQRTPTMERLTSWYHSVLAHAAKCGVVTHVMSQYESDFESHVQRLSSVKSSDTLRRMPCPPLIDGDFWIEESLRLYSNMVARRNKDLLLNLKSPTSLSDQQRTCPALVTAAMIRDKIIALPSSLAFRRPVNAAAMNLKNYHSIIQSPMDFGTVHTKCLLGEYRTLRDLVDDVELIFSNAMKFNPPQNVVHVTAINLRDKFFSELDTLTQGWHTKSNVPEQHSWLQFESTSLGLSASLPNSRAISHLVPATATTQSNTNPPATTCIKTSMADITSGASAIEERMIGGDTHLLNKGPEKRGASKKHKRKKSASKEDPATKRRRQTWLGEEVASSVRGMRTSIFKCLLGHNPQSSHMISTKEFEQYVASFNPSSDDVRTGFVADTRQGLLEFSQFRHLEFGTLRRAKYSSLVLLYHLHNHDAPGLVPCCTSCGMEISQVRWHRIGKVPEIRSQGANKNRSPQPFSPELCSSCFGGQSSKTQDDFIPLPVSSYKQQSLEEWPSATPKKDSSSG